MRADWNVRARDNYRLAIANVLDEESFRRSGEECARTVLSLLDDAPPSWRVMEYGCGVGRVLRPLAGRFGELHGVDISDEMVSRGREMLADLTNVRLHLTDGRTLPFEDGSLDLVYSLEVFQHVPKASFLQLVPELARVLRPGGVFLFHLTYPYTLRRRVQGLFGWDHPTTDTYRRRYYTTGALRRILGACGLRIDARRRTSRKAVWYRAVALAARPGARAPSSEGVREGR